MKTKTAKRFYKGAQLQALINDVEGQRKNGIGLTKALAGRWSDTAYTNALKRMGASNGSGHAAPPAPRIQVDEVAKLREENQILRNIVSESYVDTLIEQRRRG